MTSSWDVVAAALRLVSVALRAESSEAAVSAVRADVEVLSREDLVRVVTALAVDIPLHRVPVAHRAKLLQRVERGIDRAMLETAWGES